MRKFVIMACSALVAATGMAAELAGGANESITRLCRERFAPTAIPQGPAPIQQQGLPNGVVHTAQDGGAPQRMPQGMNPLQRR